MSIFNILLYFLLGYFALTIFFYTMSLVVPKAAFAARALASYISLIFVAAYGVLASIFLTLIGKQQIAQWAVGRCFHHVMRFTTGIEFVVEDPDNILGTTRPAVFIGNHQTELDVFMLGRVFPKYCSVTAKSSLKKMPFLGQFMSLSGSIFIDRKNSKDAREAMKGAANEIKSKRQSVYMFPEGTRSYAKEPMLLPFKKGAFHLAVQAGVPIVPCVVANYSHVLYLKDFTFNSGKIPVKILKPIPTKDLTPADVDELTRTTYDLMLNELVTLTAKARGQPIAVPASTGDSTGGKSSGIDTNGSAH
ncbi:1-acyl-sn-glycerol-3-phosphate acyltransferase [Fusarium austroafricanum]|uniref:1-acyl-sn-glycerol-3-phosphate acyltransferase n=1 Tax=Fusarium austroafricanum TaxID=2364996 RepID=A0A8H4KET9_9HYPO|nr:1-acyl-sn-glycerol-3-phosphate acyltransferase [Fusarium austroafricanum]